MSKKDISWKIDRLGALIRIDEPVSIIGNEWAQLATGMDADLEIPFNSEDPSKPLIIFTILDKKKYVIGYFKERNFINIHLDFDEADISEVSEITHEVDNFYDSVKRLSTTYLSKSIVDLKLGIEMIDYIETPTDGVKKLRNDFSYFSGIDEDISEIDLKLKSSLITDDEVEVSKTIEFSNKTKLKIVVDSDIENSSTKNIITADIELSVTEKDTGYINPVKNIDILKRSLLSIVKEELCYESNIKE